MPITEFVLGGPTADEQAVLSVRLTTQRPDGASEHFRDENRTQLGDTLWVKHTHTHTHKHKHTNR